MGKVWSREEFPIHHPRNGPGGSTDSSLALLTSVDFSSDIGHSNQNFLLQSHGVLRLGLPEWSIVTARHI